MRGEECSDATDVQARMPFGRMHMAVRGFSTRATSLRGVLLREVD